MVAADSDRVPRVPPYSGGHLGPAGLACKGLSPATAALSNAFQFDAEPL